MMGHEQMKIDFFALYEETQKGKKEEILENQAEKGKKVKKEQKPKERKKTRENKEKQGKTNITKEIKPLSFEEQYQKATGQQKMVVDYLLSLDGMKEKMEDEKVSIEKMWQYITEQARKKAVDGCAMVQDNEVYGWGRHYYDEHGNTSE